MQGPICDHTKVFHSALYALVWARVVSMGVTPEHSLLRARWRWASAPATGLGFSRAAIAPQCINMTRLHPYR